MRGGALRRRCRTRLEALEVPEPWDFEEFCTCVASHTGRALRMIPIPTMPEGLCGVCISTASADYVYTPAGTTPFHREHIAIHEIGHLLAGHQGGVGVGDLATILLPDLDPAVVRAILGRTSYTNDQEREAEYFATLVMERSHPSRVRRRITAADPAVAAVLGRLEDTWGRRTVSRRSGTLRSATAIGSPVGDARGA